MPDGILILLLLALFVLACLAAYLIGRRYRAVAKGDLRARYVRARWLCIFYGIIFLLETFIIFQRHDQPWFKKLYLPVLFAVCFGMFFFQFLQARRKMRAEPGFKEQKFAS